MADRRLDIALLGASGFTGALTAEYLAANAPAGLRWALVGRNPDKLARVRERLGQGAAELEIMRADIGDDASLRAVAEAAKVVITTVGPYTEYGEPVVAACAAAGTDYVDLTGEPEWVDRMFLRYGDQARGSGARIVHSCGFDSIPYDLGTLFTVSHLPEGVPLHVDCFVRANGMFSGGTYQSALHALGRLRQGAQAARDRRRREGEPPGRRVRGNMRPPHHDDTAGGWVVPFPSIDPQTVLRSARALDRYGPDFSYGHYLAVKRLPMVAGMAVGAGTLVALAQLPVTRSALAKLRPSGQGPSPEQRAKGWFSVRLRGEGGGERVIAEVTGGDPGYGETSKMLAESALCLAFDELPERAGQLTPAVAMGEALIRRLDAAGIGFRVTEGAAA